MSKITSLESGKKNPKRVNVFLDGTFAFAISRELKILNKLKVGDSLTPKQIDVLIFQDQTDRLFEKALKFLSFRPRSRKEVATNLLGKLRTTDKGELEKKNFEKSVEEVLGKLQKLGQIDDKEFAKWWFEQRTKFKKIAPNLIKRELLVKGVEREILNQVMEEAVFDDFGLAKSSAEKKLVSFKNLEPREFRYKMGRYLASKGFSWQTAKKVVDTLLKEA